LPPRVYGFGVHENSSFFFFPRFFGILPTLLPASGDKLFESPFLAFLPSFFPVGTRCGTFSRAAPPAGHLDFKLPVAHPFLTLGSLGQDLVCLVRRFFFFHCSVVSCFLAFPCGFLIWRRRQRSLPHSVDCSISRLWCFKVVPLPKSRPICPFFFFALTELIFQVFFHDLPVTGAPSGPFFQAVLTRFPYLGHFELRV